MDIKIEHAIEAARPRLREGQVTKAEVFKAAVPPPGVVPAAVKPMAMDDDIGAWVGGASGAGVGYGLSEGLGWMGYPYLAELSQRAEYRLLVSTVAREMTRRWIRVTATGNDKTDKIKVINEQLDRLKLKERARQVLELDGYFGRGHWFLDFKNDPKLNSVAVVRDPRSVEPKSFRAVKVVEPVWTYPAAYNSRDPLADDFYQPVAWYVMGQEVHRTRLLTFSARPVPDLLKPAYSFGGISITQMAKPYVDEWLDTKSAVADMVRAFSTMVLKTDMSGVLEGGGLETERARADLFSNFRNNRDLMMLDKEREELENVSAPLGGLDHLMAQFQEHMAMPAEMPLVVLTGITPSGLNASSEGELQTWAQRVNGWQESDLRPPITIVIEFIQLSEFGEIDPEIGFVFEPLEEESGKDKANRRQLQSQTDKNYVDAGVLAPEEIRLALSQEEDNPYAGVDLSAPPPEPPPDPMMGHNGGPAFGGSDEGGGGDMISQITAAIMARRG